MLRREKQKHDESAPFENIYQRDAYHRVRGRYRRHLQRNVHSVIFIIATLLTGAILAQRIYQLRVDGFLLDIYLRGQVIPIAILGVIWLAVLASHFAWVRHKDNEDAALEAALERYRGYPPAHKQKEYEEVEETFQHAPDDRSWRLSDDGEIVEKWKHEDTASTRAARP